MGNNAIYSRLDKYLKIIKSENPNYLAGAGKTKEKIKRMEAEDMNRIIILDRLKRLQAEDIATTIFSEEAAGLLIDVAEKGASSLAERVADEYLQGFLSEVKDAGDNLDLIARRLIARDYLIRYKKMDLSPFSDIALGIVREKWIESV
ncbi:MAG: hypothetical protein ABIE22_03905 [archaeon]